MVVGSQSRPERRHGGIGLAVRILALSLAVLSGCESKDDGPTGPGALRTDDPTVDAGAGALLADGVSGKEVNAYVRSEGGTPLRNVVVRFEVDAGSITPVATTNSDGRATATWTSEYSASDAAVRICASIPDEVDSSALSFLKSDYERPRPEDQEDALIVLLATGPAKASAAGEAAAVLGDRSVCAVDTMRGVTVLLSAAPGQIPADGVSAAMIRADVRETTRGVPVPGLSVGFGTTAGSVESAKETDGQGIALARLTGKAAVDTATVRAYVGGVAAATTSVPFRPIVATLGAAPGRIPADGAATADVIAAFLSEERAPLPGVLVTFETDRGVIASPVTTGGDGRAIAKLTSAPEPGTARVIARYAGGPVDTVEVDFVNDFRPARVVLSSEPSAITANGVSGATLRATVLDSTGAYVMDGTPVWFQILSGGGVVPGQVGTESGTATAGLTSGTATGIATVRAFAGTAADTVEVRYVAGPPAMILVSANPAALIGNGIERSSITASVIDAFGNPLPAGREVRFEATRGEIEPSAPTDSFGIATAAYTAGFGGGNAKITVRAGDAPNVVSAHLTLGLLSGPPTAILLDSLNHEEIRIQGTGYPEAATMVFRVYDANGVPIGPGTPAAITFDLAAMTDGGGEYLYPAADTTDEWGRVRTTLNSGTRPGVTETIARIANPFIESQLVPVAIHGFLPDPAHLDLAADTLNIPGLIYDGWENPITAFVFDRFTNPVPAGTAVYFSVSHGGIEGSAVTDSLGRATVTLVTLRPRPADGFMYIVAQTADSLGHAIRDTTWILWSGNTIPITVDPESFAIADGGSQYFTYHVSDFNGNPLTQHTTVAVSATSGTLAGDIDFDLPDAIGGTTDFGFYLGDATPGDPIPPVPVFVTISVTSLNGDASITIPGTID
ncbi:MAG: invasin domain 3-containing protein [Candidatus Eisenbacteria bacterium]